MEESIENSQNTKPNKMLRVKDDRKVVLWLPGHLAVQLKTKSAFVFADRETVTSNAMGDIPFRSLFT